MAFNFQPDGKFVKSDNCTFYIIRAVLYSITFLIGNFYTEQSEFPLEDFVFRFANFMIISFVVYVMLMSPFCQNQVINIYNDIQKLDQELTSVLPYEGFKYAIFEQTLGCTAYCLLTFILNHFNDYTLMLQLQYTAFFLVPEIVQYTALFHFTNLAWLIKQKLEALNLAMKTATSKDMRKMVRTYEKIFYVSEDLQKCYGITLLWIMANYFTWITCDLYKFLNTMLQNKTDPSILAVVSHYLVIIHTVSVCSKAKEEVELFKMLFVSKMIGSEEKRHTGEVCPLKCRNWLLITSQPRRYAYRT